jgi:hypothetical protein
MRKSVLTDALGMMRFQKAGRGFRKAARRALPTRCARPGLRRVFLANQRRTLDQPIA